MRPHLIPVGDHAAILQHWRQSDLPWRFQIKPSGRALKAAQIEILDGECQSLDEEIWMISFRTLDLAEISAASFQVGPSKRCCASLMRFRRQDV